jgi:hypothetical protein
MDVEAGAQITLKTEEVIELLAKSYADTKMDLVAEYVDVLSKQAWDLDLTNLINKELL